MATRTSRNSALAALAAGVGIIVFAVLTGLTQTGGGPDWIAIITAIGGLLIAATGLYTLVRKGHGASGPASHAAT